MVTGLIKEAIGTGATLDDARNKAIVELNAPDDADVVVEIIEQATKKTLGLFGGSLAKVRAYYETPDEPGAAVKASAPAKKPEQKPEPKPEQKPAQKTAQKPVQQKAAVPPKPEIAPEPEVKAEPVGKVVSSDNPPANYLKSILAGIGLTGVSIVTRETEEEIFLEIECPEDYGHIIGRRGETLDALQYLVRLSVNRAAGEDRRVTLNIGDYRTKREETLKGIAKRQAARVLRYGRNAVLDPMNPYERRIIHTTVQALDGVESHSIGEGEGRRVVITPVGGQRYERAPDRGGRDRDRFHGGQGGGDRGGFRDTRREPYKPEPREPREPKADVQGSFRYGKIEPKAKSE